MILDDFRIGTPRDIAAAALAGPRQTRCLAA
jgi:hypothetical protein